MGFFKNRYNKVGPGVPKEEKPKKRFFLFFELVGRNFWKIITVNLLFVLCSIPIVTIGPALAGLTHVLRNLANEEQSFVASDFFDEFKNNLKQAIPAGLIMIALGIILLIGTEYYRYNLDYSKLYYILFIISLAVDIIFVFANFYVYIMIVTLNLKLKDIYKNAFIFSILGLKNNFISLISILVVTFILFQFIPIPILLILYIVIIPAFYNFIIVFNSYPVIKKYAIDPYYENNKEEHPDYKKPDVESVFTDKGISADTKIKTAKDKKSTEL